MRIPLPFAGVLRAFVLYLLVSCQVACLLAVALYESASHLAVGILFLSGCLLIVILTDYFHTKPVFRHGILEGYRLGIVMLSGVSVAFTLLNSEVPKPTSSELNFLANVSLLLTAVMGYLWLRLPLALASKIPKLVFLLHRDFYLYCLYGLYANVVKADSFVSENEVAALVDISENTFTLSKREAAFAKRVLFYCNSDTAPAEHVAKLFYSRYECDFVSLNNIVDALLVLASADGTIKSEEDKVIRNVAGIFGISSSQYERMKRLNLSEAGD